MSHSGNEMNIQQSRSCRGVGTDDSCARNNALALRRKQLQEQVAELRVQIDEGAIDGLFELGLHQAECKLENLNFEILITNHGLVRW